MLQPMFHLMLLKIQEKQRKEQEVNQPKTLPSFFFLSCFFNILFFLLFYSSNVEVYSNIIAIIKE